MKMVNLTNQERSYLTHRINLLKEQTVLLIAKKQKIDGKNGVSKTDQLVKRKTYNSLLSFFGDFVNRLESVYETDSIRERFCELNKCWLKATNATQTV